MPFFYVNGDTRFDIEDLPLDRWITIQKATGLQWHQCVGRNLLGNAEVAKAVLVECAAETGTDLPSLTVRKMVALFEFEDREDRPVEYNDGLPDPKAKATDQETT